MTSKRAFAEKFGKKVSELTGAPVSAKKSLALVDAFYSTVRDCLKTDGKIQITGDQSFEIKAVGERKGKNPKTGAEIVIPARNVVKTKLGSKFKK